MISGCIGQRQLSRARGALRILGLARNLRAAGFVFFQRRFARGDITLQPRERFGCIAGHAPGIAAIFFKTGLLTVQVGQTLFCRFKLAGQRSHAVPMRAGIIAAVRQLIAGFRSSMRCFRLRLLRFVCCLLGCGYAFIGLLRGFACFLGHAGGIAPAGKKQPRLGHFDLFGQLGVALSLLRLTPQ